MKRFPIRRQRGAETRDEPAKDAAMEESQIDQALEDSFPASDAPPWTLGVESAPSKGTSTRTPKTHRG